jgi:Reverse transcriptase (RNA-dependent DNA polymerase)
LAGWTEFIVDVNGAFLHGKFKDKHKMYMAVPKGFEKYYSSGMVLLLLKTLYGTKQAALQFW